MSAPSGSRDSSMGMNVVTTVMAFSVSAFFVLFIFARLLCAHIHLRAAAAEHAAAAAHAGDAASLAIHVERGIRGMEPSVVTTFPTAKFGDDPHPPPVQVHGVPGGVRGQGRGARAPLLRPRLPRRLHRRLAQAALHLPHLPRLHARHRQAPRCRNRATRLLHRRHGPAAHPALHVLVRTQRLASRTSCGGGSGHGPHGHGRDG